MAKKPALKRTRAKCPAGVWNDLAQKFRTCEMGPPLRMLRIQAIELLASFAEDPAFPIELRGKLIDTEIGETAQAVRRLMQGREGGNR